MSSHPLLFSGTLCGPSLCSLPSPSPRQGREQSRKGPIASQAAPLLKEPYLRTAHSALSASFSWGSASGRRGGEGGVDMAWYRCVLQHSLIYLSCSSSPSNDKFVHLIHPYAKNRLVYTHQVKKIFLFFPCLLVNQSTTSLKKRKKKENVLILLIHICYGI